MINLKMKITSGREGRGRWGPIISVARCERVREAKGAPASALCSTFYPRLVSLLETCGSETVGNEAHFRFQFISAHCTTETAKKQQDKEREGVGHFGARIHLNHVTSLLVSRFVIEARSAVSSTLQTAEKI